MESLYVLFKFQTYKIKNIYPQCRFEIPILNGIMVVTATQLQCFLSIFLHYGILSAEKGKNLKLLQSAFMKATVLHNLFWWFSFKTEKCTNSKETAILHNTGKIEDRDQYCEPQTLISVRKFFLPDTSTKHIFVLMYLSMQILLFLILKNQRLYRHSFPKISV